MEQINTLREIEDKIVEITMKMLDLDTTLEENQGKVRLAWQQKGTPSWGIDEDICFIRVTPKDSPVARCSDVLYDKTTKKDEYATKEIGYTRVYTVDWTFYGPNSYDHADKSRYLIKNNQEIIDMFNRTHLFLGDDVSMPVRLPELFQGQWWERVDFQAEYNELVIRSTKEKNMTIGNIKYIINR